MFQTAARAILRTDRGWSSSGRAYIAAPYAEKTAYPSGPRLLKTPAVRARVIELRHGVTQTAIERAAVDRDWVLSGLRKIAENGSSESARVRAMEFGQEIEPSPKDYESQRALSMAYDGMIFQPCGEPLGLLRTHRAMRSIPVGCQDGCQPDHEFSILGGCPNLADAATDTICRWLLSIAASGLTDDSPENAENAQVRHQVRRPSTP